MYTDDLMHVAVPVINHGPDPIRIENAGMYFIDKDSPFGDECNRFGSCEVRPPLTTIHTPTGDNIIQPGEEIVIELSAYGFEIENSEPNDQLQIRVKTYPHPDRDRFNNYVTIEQLPYIINDYNHRYSREYEFKTEEILILEDPNIEITAVKAWILADDSASGPSTSNRSAEVTRQ